MLSDWQWTSFPLKPTGVTWPATRQCRNLAILEFFNFDVEIFYSLTPFLSILPWHSLCHLRTLLPVSFRQIRIQFFFFRFLMKAMPKGSWLFSIFFTMLRFCLLSLHLLPCYLGRVSWPHGLFLCRLCLALTVLTGRFRFGMFCPAQQGSFILFFKRNVLNL